MLLHKRGRISMQCHASLYHPVPSKPARSPAPVKKTRQPSRTAFTEPASVPATMPASESRPYAALVQQNSAPFLIMVENTYSGDTDNYQGAFGPL